MKLLLSLLVLVSIFSIYSCGKKKEEKKKNKQEQVVGTSLCSEPREGIEVATVDYPKLKENSGIDFSNTHQGIFWTLNDAQAPAVFAIGIDGKNYGRFNLNGVQKVDWEDISLAKCFHNPAKDCIYVADTGNNDRSRSDFKVHVVEEPANYRVDGNLEIAETLTFTVPGKYNFEAMAVNEKKQEIYFISKNDDLHLPKDTSSVFELKRGATAATLMATINFVDYKISLGGKDKIITAADYDVKSKTLLLGTNNNAFEVKLKDLNEFSARAVKIDVPKMQQTEAIAYYYKDGRVHIVATSEGKAQPLYLISCE